MKKFALHLIAELVGEQVLPTAQRLLDDLIQNADSSINQQSGAPDPTRGAFENDLSVWCLDESLLQENISRTLAKFVMPTPNVVSDLECLEHTSSSAPATEYTALLRPLRGREPEGMWNLVSIVREMFRRRDDNSVPLLRIITVECLRIDQFVQLWFIVKSSQWSHNTANSTTNTNNNSVTNSSQRNSANNPVGNLAPPIHQACANLMDELVSLWRIACLNPLVSETDPDRQMYREQLMHWHQSVYERLRKFSSSSQLTSQHHHHTRRLDPDQFTGFLPALLACDMSWSQFDFESVAQFRGQCERLLDDNCEKDEQPKEETVPTKPETTPITTTTTTSSSPESDLNNLYMFDYDPSRLKSSKETQPPVMFQFKTALSAMTSEENKLEVLFSRCEALYAHGFVDHACTLAQLLANYCLNNTSFGLFNNKYIISKLQRKKRIRHIS